MRVLFTFLVFVYGCVSVSSGRIVHRTVTWFATDKVIDGCTIRIQGVGRVRYRGIVVPQEGILKPGRIAEEAYAFNKRILEGHLVRCEPEVSGVIPANETYVADVFIRWSDTEQRLAAAELLRAGLAILSADYQRSNYPDILKQAEEEARNSKRGFWAEHKR
jgi:endonuclease YncB( thermonuclease family)